jgi:alkanesulfonate monooxygenase SsuD/methylene tetrahydromethanopterin reductase-like flavin-dependent oxidoreductase (luciferase family)
MPDHAARYARAREFLEVTNKLWQGWEEGAVQPNNHRTPLRRTGDVKRALYLEMLALMVDRLDFVIAS